MIVTRIKEESTAICDLFAPDGYLRCISLLSMYGYASHNDLQLQLFTKKKKCAVRRFRQIYVCFAQWQIAE